jgi:hypothetical protein
MFGPELLGVPSALKALLDIFDRLKLGAVTPTDGKLQAEGSIAAIRGSLNAFATQASALEAFKCLHALTNTLFTDLRSTFTIYSPNLEFARTHHRESLGAIRDEYMRLNSTQRTGAQLTELQGRPELMEHLAAMPKFVRDRIKPRRLTWDQYLANLLRDSERESGNFENFSELIMALHGFNTVLNNHADASLKRGISAFNSLMKDLRSALGTS